MKIGNTLGTYEMVFANTSEQICEIADSINALIIEMDPEVCIVPRVGEKSVSYGIGSKKMSESYCYIMPHKDHLNLGFPHGSKLPDPDSILEGTGQKYRHIKISSVEQAKQMTTIDFIKTARNERLFS